MDDHCPLVSIGLPVYNGENFVAEAIQCVLSQTFSDLELVISDNASTDRTISICRKFAERDRRICVYANQRNLGVSPNYNNVFRRSRGRYFAWLAHDDYIGAEFVERCLRELEMDASVNVAFPKLVYVDAHGSPFRRQVSDLSIMGTSVVSRVRQLMRLESQSTDVFWSQFGLIRRSELERTQLMGAYSGSDQVLILEMVVRGKLKQVDKELFFRREHPDASTLRKNWTAKDRARFQYADDKRTLVFPYCRLLKEHLACIWRSSMPSWDKSECAAAVVRRFRGHGRDVVREIVMALVPG